MIHQQQAMQCPILKVIFWLIELNIMQKQDILFQYFIKCNYHSITNFYITTSNSFRMSSLEVRVQFAVGQFEPKYLFYINFGLNLFISWNPEDFLKLSIRKY